MADDAVLIGLDWGTTSMRAYLIGRSGDVLERRASPAGIMQVPDGDFGSMLATVAGDWLEAAPSRPVLAAGMIGSRQGWREVPYVPCPAGLGQLAGGLATVTMATGRTVHLVPGVLRPGGAHGFPDVMRGEETQILGALARSAGSEPRCFVLPGTHSKWAWTADAGIGRFSTYMTGEIYACLCQHTILGRLMTGRDVDPHAFDRGVERARASAAAAPGQLLHDLFSARTLGLMAELPASGLASYLSGLLIGAEVVAAAAGSGSGEVVILGSDALGPLYATAIAAIGGAAVVGDPDAAVYGLHAIAVAAGLVGENGHG